MKIALASVALLLTGCSFIPSTPIEGTKTEPIPLRVCTDAEGNKFAAHTCPPGSS